MHRLGLTMREDDHATDRVWINPHSNELETLTEDSSQGNPKRLDHPVVVRIEDQRDRLELQARSAPSSSSASSGTSGSKRRSGAM